MIALRRLGLLRSQVRGGKSLSTAVLYQGEYKFEAGSHVIPHADKVYKGGEDANYHDDSLLVVADGVGGWSAQGVDPAKYSNALVNNM